MKATEPPEATHCYVALDLDGKLYAVSVDAPEYAKDNAKFCAKTLREGGRIERMELEAFRVRSLDRRPFRLPGKIVK